MAIWDTAGQERFRSMANMYYREAAGAIVTFDLTSTESYEGAMSWIREVSIAAPEDIAIALVGQLILISLHECSIICS